MNMSILRFSQINEMGTFKNLDIKENDKLDLKKYNLIYGSNGPGKTTLSRILSSISTGNVGHHLNQHGSFKVLFANDHKVESKNLDGESGADISVFNSDFIWSNLSWGSNKARPVYYIGKKQVGHQKRLSWCNQLLEKNYSEKESKLNTDLNTAKRDLQNFKRDQASYIKEDFFISTTYTATQLDNDYKNTDIKNKSSLSKEDVDEKLEFRKLNDPKKVINYKIDTSNIELSGFIKSIEKLCQEEVLKTESPLKK